MGLKWSVMIANSRLATWISRSRRASRRRTLPQIKLISFSLMALGIGITYVGIRGDQDGWWINRPFLTNIVSGAAGAAFGIPFALLFLQGVLSRQQELSQWERRRDQSWDQFDSVSSAVNRILNDVLMYRYIHSPDMLKHSGYDSRRRTYAESDDQFIGLLENGQVARDQWMRFAAGDIPLKQPGKILPRADPMVQDLDEVRRMLDELDPAVRSFQAYVQARGKEDLAREAAQSLIDLLQSLELHLHNVRSRTFWHG